MNVEIDPAGVDWATVFGELGKPPDASLSSTALAFALKSSNQVEIEDEKHANEFIGKAIDRDGLERVDTGYVIEDHYQPQIDETDETEPGVVESEPEVTDDVEGGNVRDEIAEIRDELESLRSENRRQKAVNRRQDQLITLLLGETDLSSIEPDEMRPILDRLQAIEERVIEVEDENEQMMTLAEEAYSKPDERGQKLRQSLLNHADTDGRSALKRDDVDAILGGIHRGSVLDAMKRAADGRLASDSDRQYSPITGSSELSPVDAITFEVAKDQDAQSRIVLDADNLTGIETRQNVMTGEEG